ncbi:MAG: L-dopachrome tautomerase-related protein [Acetobacteraceae bacterium]
MDGPRIGNPAVTPDGRLLVSRHPLDAPEFKVVEVPRDGGPALPFPNPEVSRGLDAVIGVRAGEDGVVWMLDMGPRPRFVGWDTRRDALAGEVPIPAVVLRPNSFLQDFALDQTRGLAFVADMTRGDLVGDSSPAIVAVDLRGGAPARRLLQGHPSTQPPDEALVAEGRPLAIARDGAAAPVEARFGLNPITITTDDAWVIYGAMNGNGLWRVPAAALANAALSADALAARVERHREKRGSDGISVDGAGNVYVTDVAASAIGVATENGYRVLARDPALLRWPDGFAFGPDGWLYVTVNQLHLHPAVNGGRGDEGRAPWLVVRIRPLAAGRVGR